jgi:hypothetical protein
LPELGSFGFAGASFGRRVERAYTEASDQLPSAIIPALWSEDTEEALGREQSLTKSNNRRHLNHT